MNIMLISVTEHTRDILGQFLVRAVMLSLIGGLIGFAIEVFFGFFPARKAARLNATEVLCLENSSVKIASIFDRIGGSPRIAVGHRSVTPPRAPVLGR
jgi:hypothetical protein